MADTELHIAFEKMDSQRVARIAEATCSLLNRFLMQPQGREIINAKIAELKKEGFI